MEKIHIIQIILHIMVISVQIYALINNLGILPELVIPLVLNLMIVVGTLIIIFSSKLNKNKEDRIYEHTNLKKVIKDKFKENKE